MSTPPLDLTDQVFGALVALKPVASTSQGVRWLCRCTKCGGSATRAAAELRYREKRGIFQMCRPCLHLEKSVHLNRGRTFSSWSREAMQTLFDRTGSLYSASAMARLESEVRAALEEELGPPRRGFEWETLSRETGFGEDLTSLGALGASLPWDWFEQLKEKSPMPPSAHSVKQRAKKFRKFRRPERQPIDVQEK